MASIRNLTASPNTCSPIRLVALDKTLEVKASSAQARSMLVAHAKALLSDFMQSMSARSDEYAGTSETKAGMPSAA
jgi:hypothetical protein